MALEATPNVVSHLALPVLAPSSQVAFKEEESIGALREFLVRFGNPANSESPVALRPLLAKGLPFVVGHQVWHRTAVKPRPVASLFQGPHVRVNTQIRGVNSSIVEPLLNDPGNPGALVLVQQSDKLYVLHGMLGMSKKGVQGMDDARNLRRNSRGMSGRGRVWIKPDRRTKCIDSHRQWMRTACKGVVSVRVRVWMTLGRIRPAPYRTMGIVTFLEELLWVDDVRTVYSGTGPRRRGDDDED